jgi:hypothetical protein
MLVQANKSIQQLNAPSQQSQDTKLFLLPPEDSQQHYNSQGNGPCASVQGKSIFGADYPGNCKTTGDQNIQGGYPGQVYIMLHGVFRCKVELVASSYN